MQDIINHQQCALMKSFEFFCYKQSNNHNYNLTVFISKKFHKLCTHFTTGSGLDTTGRQCPTDKATKITSGSKKVYYR